MALTVTVDVPPRHREVLASWLRSTSIAPHTTTNLVFAQTRTSDHPESATMQVSYTAGSNSYTRTELDRVMVAVKCF